ncbi:MAG TPA: mersacidin/lichenicidin family type 2 lantibiotic [Ktedonosporobacter sp.]|nr:mersacidin/lichenicidin family type 2 lantibiotic [Ktedonosporobacter sp.]
MNTLDIVRAWKDAAFRHGLSAEEQALLPEHPAGAIGLTDEELSQVEGGSSFQPGCSCIPLTIPDSPLCVPNFTQQ